MGTRRNFANLSFKSVAACKSRPGGRGVFPKPVCLKTARERMAQAKRKTAAIKRAHLEGMAGAFYQSFLNRYKRPVHMASYEKRQPRPLLEVEDLWGDARIVVPDAGPNSQEAQMRKNVLKAFGGTLLAGVLAAPVLVSAGPQPKPAPPEHEHPVIRESIEKIAGGRPE